MAKTQNLHFRATADVIARLDEQAESLRISCASLIRGLIEQGLGNDTQLDVLREAHFQTSAIVRGAVGRVVAELGERLPTVLDEEMAAAGLLPTAAE